MKLPLISVIIPVYNVEKYLNLCIESVVNQTYKNIEIILVDDGSPDQCPEICEEWSRKDSRIRVIHKTNGGLSDARNVGMRNSTGEYISFVDSDDWIDDRFIETLYEVIVENNCDFSGCKFRMVNEYQEIISTEEIIYTEVYDTISGLSALIDDKIRQVVWNKLYKRTLIENIYFERGKCHEDEFWSYQVFANSKKYVETNFVGYNYLQRESSIMGERYSLKRLDAIEAKVHRQRFLEKNFPELDSRAKVNLIFSCMSHGQFAITYLKGEEKEYVFNYLKRIVKENKMNQFDYKGLKATHRVWLFLSYYALEYVCRVRQRLHIGL